MLELLEEITEPHANIFGAAMLGAAPDLGQVIAIGIVQLILHVAAPAFGENAVYAASSRLDHRG
jgi:hypothetical protein